MDGFITIFGRPVHYRKEGNGPPVVLVHGLGGSMVAWCRVIEPLSRNFTVYAFDLPGHGQSGAFEDHEANLSFATLFVEEFRRTFSFEQPVFIGGSMGGLTVLQYALYFPHRVKKLILPDSAGLGRDIAFSLRLATLPFLGEFLTRPTRKNIENTIKQMVTDVSCVPREAIDQMCKNGARPGNHEMLLKLLRYGVNMCGQKEKIIKLRDLPRIKTPTLIVWGEKDKIIPVEHGRRAARLIPNATLRVFPNAGHWPHMQYPEEFSKAVREFVLN